MSKAQISIKIKGFYSSIVEKCTIDIINTAKVTGAQVSGAIPLPVDIEKYCVNRSPHVDKKSMDHFEQRTYKRIIYIGDPTVQTIDSLKKLQFPSGMDIKIQIK